MTAKEMNILVSDDVSDSGLQPLRDAGFALDKKTGLAPDALRGALRDCDALIVRSETKVTAELMDAAKKLRVIGRAGVGVDNIDVAAATATQKLLLKQRESHRWGAAPGPALLSGHTGAQPRSGHAPFDYSVPWLTGHTVSPDNTLNCGNPYWIDRRES